MRLAAFGLYHEANTFSPLVADRTLFERGGLFRGDEVTAEYATSRATMGGFLAAGTGLGVEVTPLLFARVNPVGAITADAFEAIVQEGIDLLAGDGPWDGVLLALHGAAVAETHPDADGEIAARVRAAVGPDTPVGAVLDMHANVSGRMVDALTVVVGYRTNPHVDAYERALECAGLVVRTARGEVRPVSALADPPLAVDILRQDTSEAPMSELLEAAAELRRRPGLLSASVFEGFPYADVPEMGMSFVAVADGDKAVATQAARELAAHAWRVREDLRGVAPTAAAALRTAGAAAAGPVVLLDVGDNIGGGAPGDSTVLLAEARRQGIRSLLQTLWDPAAVSACRQAGVGAEVSISVGARHPHSAGDPVPVSGRVRHLSDGRFEEPGPVHGGFRFFDMGSTAVVDTSDGHTLVLTSRQTPNTSLQQMRSIGIDPTTFGIVVAKGVNAPRAAWAPVASALIAVDTPGITTARLDALPYRHRRRPLYPLELDADYR